MDDEDKDKKLQECLDIAHLMEAIRSLPDEQKQEIFKLFHSVLGYSTGELAREIKNIKSEDIDAHLRGKE